MKKFNIPSMLSSKINIKKCHSDCKPEKEYRVGNDQMQGKFVVEYFRDELLHEFIFTIVQRVLILTKLNTTKGG